MQCSHLEAPVSRWDNHYFYSDGTPAGFLCPDCARTAGFCPSCGRFIAGIDVEIHYMAQYGCCSNCASELVDQDEIL